jgi:hypothetical protein
MLSHLFSMSIEPTAISGLVIAQFQSTDILGNMQNGWTDFLQTGKAGALTVGLVMGYMIRGITK